MGAVKVVPDLAKNKIVAVLTTKGGEGKTTLVINIATCLALMGYRVLVVDTDPQQSLVTWFMEGEGEPAFNVMATVNEKEIKNLHTLQGDYDFILVDGAATVAYTTAAAIACADLVLIPVKASPLSFAATSSLRELVTTRRKTRKLPAHFIMTMIQARAALNDVLAASIDKSGFPRLKKSLRNRQVFPRSMWGGRTVFDENSYAARQAQGEIELITKEIMGILASE